MDLTVDTADMATVDTADSPVPFLSDWAVSQQRRTCPYPAPNAIDIV